MIVIYLNYTILQGFMKDTFNKFFSFLLKPNLIFKIICYVLFLLSAILTIVFLFLNINQSIMIIFYSIMGVTFFYSCYLFIIFDYPKFKQFFINLKIKLCEKSKFINSLYTDAYFRTMMATCFSLFLGFCFVGYNAFAGIYYHSIWNGSISVYYIFLVIIRILILISEYKITQNQSLTPQEIDQKRIKMFTLEGQLLICVNLALIAPITLLATSQKIVSLPYWVAIANAGYTFYKVISCVYTFVKSRKNTNLSIKGIKNLNLTSACVSLLSLENTMIITFSQDFEPSMQTLMILSSLACTIINNWIAIATLVSSKKLQKSFKNNIIQKD